MEPLLVDSHCHLDLLNPAAYEGGITGVVAAARAQGVGWMLNACVNLKAYEKIRDLARCYRGIFAAVGVHPNQQLVSEPDEDELLRLAREPEVVAVGETGLDYYRTKIGRTPQQARFRRHIAVAKRVGKPLIVHCRQAMTDTLRILREEGAHELGGVIHCFVGDWEAARQTLDLDFCISLSGSVTFKNTPDLQTVAVQTPLDRLLIETDAPYLTPLSRRGQPNQPAYVRLVAEHVAMRRNMSFADFAQASTENFFGLFRHAPQSQTCEPASAAVSPHSAQ